MVPLLEVPFDQANESTLHVEGYMNKFELMRSVARLH